MSQTIASIYFIGPRQVKVRHETCPHPGSGQVLVQTLLSAISPGTEMLFYRGQFPTGIAVDEGIGALAGTFQYPLRYGYAAVGRVSVLGESVDPSWQDRLVFAFQPHTSHFLASPGDLHIVPAGISTEEALFLPNMETAVNFVMDGAPLVGERVAVFGLGIVGLLTTAVLARFPLENLITFDLYPRRRQAALETGATASLDPTESAIDEKVRALLPTGADLAFELSGSPQALDRAIASTAFSGRVLVGSWYGQKRAALDLGGYFHRSRIRLISSQVTTLSPELSGRWNKERRFSVAWEMIRQINPQKWITHRFPLDQAPQAYDLLDHEAEQAIQVIFDYSL
jgi:2-desacetyl-2-hydroxyethyl bacteriochlorophyllide A dehydrogenase